MHDTEKIKNLEALNESVGKIFNIEQTEHISSENKITGIKFNLNQSNRDLNYIIVELLNLYIVPAFVLPNSQKNKTTEIISIKIENGEKKFVTTTTKGYVKQANTYIENTQLEQQKNNRGFFKKVIGGFQDLINAKEEIEFIEINKGNLNFQTSSDKNTEVEITFAESKIDIKHIESILNCVSKFKELTNNNKSLIEVDCNHPISESQDKLNIYPFFAEKIVNDDVKSQKIVLCLTTKQNDVELASSIFRNNTSQLKIKCKDDEYSLLSYNLNSSFSQNLVDFLLFFNDPSHNGEAQISNLQRIAKIFSEDIEIKGDKKENSSNKAKIRIENTACFTSSLHYEGGSLQLKKSSSGEKIYFNFEVRVENDLDQKEKESKFMYDSTIYKIVSLISFFALCFDKFSISVEVDKENIFFIKKNLYSKPNLYLELASNIDEKLVAHAVLTFINRKDKSRSQHIQVLDLLRTKKVEFKLKAKAQEIAINRLKDIKGLMSGVSILNSHKREFLDNISDPSHYCLSNFAYVGNNLSCVYAITYPKDFSILQSEFQKSFECVSNNLKQIEKEKNLLAYSIDINIDKLLNQSTNRPQEEETIEVTEATEIIGEEVKAESQKRIEYDVDWQKEHFAKIIPANDYTSLENDLKEACKFVHDRTLHVCEQLLKKINILQYGKDQKVEQNDQFFIDEPTAKAALDKNISNFDKFIEKKDREFEAIKPNLDVKQREVIASIENSILNVIQRYEEAVKIHLFINKNANDLQKILKKNVEELEKLIPNIQKNNIDQMIDEIDKSLGSTQSDSTIEQTEVSDIAICSTEGSQGAESGNAEKGNIQENDNLSPTSSSEQTDCIEENGEVENKVTLEYILGLFNKLNKKSVEWYTSEVESWLISTIDQGFGESEGEDDFDTSKRSVAPEIDTSRPQIYDTWNEQVNCFLNQFELKIHKCINVKKQNFDKEQVEIINLDQYKQILNLVNNIFYTAKLLHYYKIQDNFGKLETEIHNIERITHDCLKKELDEKEKEFKKREAQLEQEISVRKFGRTVTQGISFILNSAGNIPKLAKEIFRPTNESSSKVCNSHSNINHYADDGIGVTRSHTESFKNYREFQKMKKTKLCYRIRKSLLGQTHESSNLKQKKDKSIVKIIFSEKENYIFLTFSILGAAGILAYFVPEGLRKFVPSEKLNTVDITVAIGGAALIIIGLTALAYSVYANIVYSNMIDPMTSSHNQNLFTNK